MEKKPQTHPVFRRLSLTLSCTRALRSTSQIVVAVVVVCFFLSAGAMATEKEEDDCVLPTQHDGDTRVPLKCQREINKLVVGIGVCAAQHSYIF